MQTVVAAATPRGRSALAVVRLTGSEVLSVLKKVARPRGKRGFVAGRPLRVDLEDEEGCYDDGLLTFGRGPATYTGEDLAEISCHGNPLIVQRLLHACIDAGARMAQAGEFTRRGLLNGKFDLITAEAVLQVTEARTQRGVEIGRLGASGELSAMIDAIRGPLVTLTAELEARLDYPGDDLNYLSDRKMQEQLSGAESNALSLARSFDTGHMLVHGAKVAIVGPVNAGKSSLFNALLTQQRALVHDQPGTTRDVLEATTEMDGVAVTLLDTAGERSTDDPVEAAGLALAREMTQDADLLLVVLRAREGGLSQQEKEILRRTEEQPRVLVYNGVDGVEHPQVPEGAFATVALTSQGVNELQQGIVQQLLGQETGADRHVIASARQRDLFVSLAREVAQARQALPVAGVAVAADFLTQGIEVIDELTGLHTRESILDELFSRFCIGK